MLGKCKDSFSQLVRVKILPLFCAVEAMRTRRLNLSLALVYVQHHQYPLLGVGDAIG